MVLNAFCFYGSFCTPIFYQILAFIQESNIIAFKIFYAHSQFYVLRIMLNCTHLQIQDTFCPVVISNLLQMSILSRWENYFLKSSTNLIEEEIWLSTFQRTSQDSVFCYWNKTDGYLLSCTNIDIQDSCDRIWSRCQMTVWHKSLQRESNYVVECPKNDDYQVCNFPKQNETMHLVVLSRG